MTEYIVYISMGEHCLHFTNRETVPKWNECWMRCKMITEILSVFHGNKTYTPKWQKHSVADTHRSMHSFSCVYEKHFLNTFYMRPKRRTLTQKERVPARIWRNPACSFHTWIHISLVWFGLEYRVFPHHFKSTSKLKLREMCDNVNGTQQQWQSRKNITNELERIVKNVHIDNNS